MAIEDLYSSYSTGIIDAPVNVKKWDNDFAQKGWGASTPMKGTNTSGGLASWFRENKDMLGGISQGLGGLADLGSLYMGYKNYQMGKDKFNAEKALASANYMNQAKAYNEQLGRQADVGLALAGSSLTPEQRAATLAKVQAGKVAENVNL